MKFATVTTFIFAIAQAQGNDSFAENCPTNIYYKPLMNGDPSTNPKDWDKLDIGRLLKSTHVKVLPYTANNREDVWDALIDLDATSSSTVRLIYKQADVAAQDYGTSTTWNREHLWPKSLGVGTSGADFTDVHHLRPADWNVNSARNNLYFGSCFADAADGGECDVPAAPEAADGTSKDSVVFLPPPSVRGDIARAIFYMDVRYYGDGNDVDLELTDCPQEGTNQMAYLSQLLEWHYADPVDTAEEARNDRVCTRWQGNRNVFVDHPELVEAMYGRPQTTKSAERSTESNYYGYANCQPDGTSPTPSPTSVDAKVDSCDDLSPGDVQIVAVHSDNPDVVAMVALENLPENMELCMTDNAWMGEAFRSNEGKRKMKIPSGGIGRGTVFGYSQDTSTVQLLYGSDWQTSSGNFALAATGDTVFVYCETSSNASTMLGGFSYAGASFLEPGLDEDAYGTDQSALPQTLQGAATALKHFDNYAYNGPRSGTKSELLAQLQKQDNWEGSNSQRVPFETTTFDVQGPSGPGAMGNPDGDGGTGGNDGSAAPIGTVQRARLASFAAIVIALIAAPAGPN